MAHHQTFKFSLERVRKLRVDAEDRAREEFASSLADRLRGEAMLRSAQDAVRAAQDSQRDAAEQSVSGFDLLTRQAYVDRMHDGARSAELAVHRADVQVQARRSALGDASRDREVLERLKQRKSADHRRELDRRETNVLDDMATAAYVRKAAA